MFRSCLLQSSSQLRSSFPVALQAERAHIGEVALAASFRHCLHVVGIPKRLPAILPQPPCFEEPAAGGEIQLAHIPAQRHGIHAALRAHAAIAIEYLPAQITGIRAQLPLMHA